MGTPLEYPFWVGVLHSLGVFSGAGLLVFMSTSEGFLLKDFRRIVVSSVCKSVKLGTDSVFHLKKSIEINLEHQDT